MEQTNKKGFKSFIKNFFSSRISRILPSALISLAIPLIIFISIPLETYTGNIEQMRFSFNILLWRGALITLGVWAILFITQFIPPKIVYFVIRGLYIAVGLLLFMQANFLNIGLTSLAGDDALTIVDMVGKSTVVINTIIWIVVIVGIITLSVFEIKIDFLKVIAFVLTLVVLLPTCLTTTVNAVTSDFSQGSAIEQMKEEDPDYVPTFLTTKNINKLGRDNNVVIFIIDRFDAKEYMDPNLEEYTNTYFNNWGGFTYFNDNISTYGRTYPSVTYLLTGVKHQSEQKRKEFFNNAFSTNKTLSKLAQEGYSINVYTDPFYGYYDAYYLPSYIDNIETASEESLYTETTMEHNLYRSNMMITFYRLLPFALKDMVGGVSSDSMNKYVLYKSDELQSPEASTDLKRTYDAVTQTDFETDKSKNFSFIHVYGTHGVPYNEDWGTPKGKDKTDVTISLRHSFNILNEYISEMKRCGVYDNSTIIITGDHAITDDHSKLLSQTKHTPLFVKPSNSSQVYGQPKPLEINTAPVSHLDIWPTIFESEGITWEQADFENGTSVFDTISADRVREKIWHTVPLSNGSFKEYTYQIKGSAKDFKNWKINEEKTKGPFNRELTD